MKIKSFLMTLAIAATFFLASCGSTTAPTTYTIGGTISGLVGTGLVLQDNGGNNLSVPAGTMTFTFTNAVDSGAAYAVTVLTQPSSPAQTCTVTYGGSGTATSDVVIVEVTCLTNTFTIGGTVSGLSGTGLVLQDNGGNNLAIGANGNYTFPTPISRGSSYNVTLLTQPSSPAQTCGVTNGYGASLLGNVTDIHVNCITTTVTYTIGGTVSGLSGTGLMLQNNSGNNLAVSANGGFTFTTPVASGSAYSVTVLTQPSTPTQNCIVTGGGGTASANVTGIVVNCTTVTYPIAGTITGLTGTGLVLQDNGGDNLAVAANATSFTFATQLASGANYAVTVLTQPSGQTCAVTNGTGTVTNSGITSITIACTTNASNVGVTVSGLLPNTVLVLQDNRADNLTVSANGVPTSFHTSMAKDSSYAVTVLTQPAGATCTVGASGSGTLASGNVNVAVTCGTILAAGEAHTCALTSAGAVLCWGANEYGQLGDGNTANPLTPVAVTGLSSGVVSISAGYDSTCALTGAGAVWCWGYNGMGQLGDGTFTQTSTPVRVLDSTGNAPLSGIVGISAGQYHTCAVTNDGAALCWGDNAKGELGNGTEVGSNLPVAVSRLSSGVGSISAGSRFTCATTIAGGAWCWGEGDSGQLGNGASVDSSTPQAVLDSTGITPLSGLVAISAGFADTCALTSGETVFCWGANDSGQLGNNSIGAQSKSPVEVLDSTGNSALSGVVAIAGGRGDICAVVNGGAALCWGNNEYGQLGNGTVTDSTAPAPVSGLSSGVQAIAAGSQHACAATSVGAAQCWGENTQGQLGIGSTTPSFTPLKAIGIGDSSSSQLY